MKERDVSRSGVRVADARGIKWQYPFDDRIQSMSGETHTIVSEPLGDLADAWSEAPEANVVEMCPGVEEFRAFTLRR